MKSTSTMFSCSGEWVIARPSTRVRRNSGLAGPGGADDEAVRAHALLGRLLDVEVDHAAALAEADRHPQAVARGPRPPRRRRVETVHVAEAEEVHEVLGPVISPRRPGAADTVCSGVSRRANASAVAGSHWSRGVRRGVLGVRPAAPRTPRPRDHRPRDFMDLLGLGDVHHFDPGAGVAAAARPRPAARADRPRPGRRPGRSSTSRSRPSRAWARTAW